MNTSATRAHLASRLFDNEHALRVERAQRRKGNGHAPYEAMLRKRIKRLRRAIDYLASRLYTQLEKRTQPRKVQP